MNRIVKRIVLPVLPTAVHRRLRARKRPGRSHDHRDATFLMLTPEIVFETCWKDVEAGRGPALIVWVDDCRILKFDCFGKGRGHYHVSSRGLSLQPVSRDRLYLPEETIEAQIERVAFELKTNLAYYLAHAPSRRARRARIPERVLAQGVEEARSSMLEHMAAALSWRERAPLPDAAATEAEREAEPQEPSGARLGNQHAALDAGVDAGAVDEPAAVVPEP